MKNISSLLIVCFLLLSMGIQANTKQETTSDNDSTLGVHPWKETSNLSHEFAHWSMTFEAGFDLIDGDFHRSEVTIAPKTRIRPTGGFSLQYDFTTTWGLMGLYTYANYGFKPKGSSEWTLYGHLHSLDLLLTYDLVDAWFPHRKHDIFSCYIMGGLGMAFFNSDLQTDAGIVKPRSDERYEMAGSVAMGIAFEFNISRPLALGVKGMYHIYTKDNVDGRVQGNSNDCQEYVSAYLRWKIEGKKKNHLRNFPNEDLFAAQLQDNDESKKKEPLKDTVVVFSRDTVIVQQEYAAPEVVQPQDYEYVYFANDKYLLDDLALVTIQQFANKMQKDSSICADLVGYCDYTGSEKYNQGLSQQRADRVAKELIDIYGISADRIVTVGNGMLTNVANSYRPNRRVELHIISQEECKQLKAERKNIDSTQKFESKEQTKVQGEKPAVLTTVTSVKDATTLSRLARKYYNNADCWVFIYAANRDRLSNPDFIPENIAIDIPDISEEQKNISHKEALQIAEGFSNASVSE